MTGILLVARHILLREVLTLYHIAPWGTSSEPENLTSNAGYGPAPRILADPF